MRLILFILLIPLLTRASEIEMGLYQLDTGAGWAAGFELKENHKVIITSAVGNEEEDYDAAGNSLTKKPDVVGTWKKTNEGIQISYGKVTDYFKYTPNECEYFPESPCFKHIKSQSTDKSILNYEQAWVNRKVKLKPSKKLVDKQLAECQQQCDELAAKKQLKKGMAVSDCISAICKAAR